MTRAPRLTKPSAQRSSIMRAIKSRDTGPERALRRLLWPLARGYRLHARELPGTPDVVYRQRKLAIFMHGCFWHGHDCARGSRQPKANAAYWRKKIARNRARDEEAVEELRAMGWRTLEIFECALTGEAKLRARLKRALARAGGD